MKITRTVTTIFMIPTLEIGRKTLFDNGFINGYVDYKDKELFYSENVVYLLFKPKDIQLFKEFINNEYERTESILEDFNVNNDYVISVYKLPKKLKKDFLLIKQGKYSKTSKMFQNIFPDKLTDLNKKILTKQVSLQYRIFNKDEALLIIWEDALATNLIRDHNLEVWPEFNKEKETLNLKTLLT